MNSNIIMITVALALVRATPLSQNSLNNNHTALR